MKYFIELFVFIFSTASALSEIEITEAVPSNGSLFDFYDDDPDWIELYNPADSAVNLSGYRISDKKKFSKGYCLNGLVIPAKSYKTIFASGRALSLEKIVVCNQSAGFQKYKKSDDFHFDYVKLAGDFSAEFNLACMRKAPSGETCAGIMLRRSLTPTSEYAAAFLSDLTSYEIAVRYTPKRRIDSAQTAYYKILDFPNEAIKMERRADSIYFYRWDEGIRWNLSRTYYFPFSDSLYLGAAFSSADSAKAAEFVVNYFKIDGKEMNFDSLNHFDIGFNNYNSESKEREFHTNFKISATESETINLWNPQQKLVSSLQVPFVSGGFPCNVSAAVDSCGKVRFSSPATPDAENANFLSGKTSIPEISFIGSQWQKNPFSVKIDNIEAGASVFYTLDGSKPTIDAIKYNGGDIRIDSNCVLRAAAFKAGKLQSYDAVKSFMISDSSTLPVLAVTVSPEDLYSDPDGLLFPYEVHYKQDKQGYFEYFDRNKKEKFASRTCVNLSGDLGRTLPQKSLKLSAKHEFAPDDFAYPFFSVDSVPFYHILALKNTSQTWKTSMLNDAVSSLAANGFLRNTVSTSYEPVLTYLNGKFYGLSEMKNKTEEHYIASLYGIEEDSINLITAFCELKSGSREPFYEFVNKFSGKDFSEDKDFDELCKYFDLDNFIDYTVAQLYTGNNDWPYKNVIYWQSNELDSKWRFAFYDLDCTIFDPNAYNFEIMRVDSSYSSQLYRALATNNKFINTLINRACDLNNTVFRAERMNHLIDSAAALIRPEIARQRADYPESCQNWQQEVDSLHACVNNRNEVFSSQIDAFYSKGGKARFVFDSTFDGARVILNTIELDSFPWSGTYIHNTPVEMTIIPPPDSVFRCWKINDHVYYDSVLTYQEWLDTAQISICYLDTTAADTIPSDTAAVGEFFAGAQIYPNPFSSRLTISLPEFPQIESITLLDATGREIWHRSYSENLKNILKIDNLDGLSAGAYYVNIKRRGLLPCTVFKVIKK